jgi:hypothetical protein
MKQNIGIEISFFRYWDEQDKRSREKVCKSRSNGNIWTDVIMMIKCINVDSWRKVDEILRIGHSSAAASAGIYIYTFYHHNHIRSYIPVRPGFTYFFSRSLVLLIPVPEKRNLYSNFLLSFFLCSFSCRICTEDISIPFYRCRIPPSYFPPRVRVTGTSQIMYPSCSRYLYRNVHTEPKQKYCG